MNRSFALSLAAVMAALTSACSTTTPAPTSTVAPVAPVAPKARACGAASKPQQAVVVNGKDYTNIARSVLQGASDVAASLGFELPTPLHANASSKGAAVQGLCVILESPRALNRLRNDDVISLRFVTSSGIALDPKSLRIAVGGQDITPRSLTFGGGTPTAINVRLSGLPLGPQVLTVSARDAQQREALLEVDVNVLG